MIRYLLRRLVMTAAVAVALIVLMGLLVHLVPGNPVTAILGPRAAPEAMQRVTAEMGLDDPVWRQVVDFFAGALQGDLGRDFVSNEPVTSLLANALPHTILLAGAAMGLAALVGIPLGVFGATRQGSLADRVTSLVSVSMITMPSFLSGLLLLLAFPILLGLLPSRGAGRLTDPVAYLRHLILPATALAITWVGYLARVVRTSMLEVLNEDYIRVARAYGLRERDISYRFALKNGIIPTVALLGVSLGELLGGAMFVEVIYSRPGLGRLFVNAIG